jgi:outer membrane lipoprotein
MCRLLKLQALLLLVYLISGCSHAISPEVRKTTREDLMFPTVAQKPSAYVGERVIWGGLVMDTLGRRDATDLLVMELPLSRLGRPLDRKTRGKFIARASGRLDRETYQPGKIVTVAGEIVGFEGELPAHAEPVVMVSEIHMWKEQREFRDYKIPYDRRSHHRWWW